MKRLAAVVAAAALILAAVLVRRQIDGPSVAEQEQSTPLRLVCERLFETACNAIPRAQVRIEDPMTTATAIASGPGLEADAWVTTDLWTSIAASRAGSHNGRFARNLFEASVARQAARIVAGRTNGTEPTADSLATLTGPDLSDPDPSAPPPATPPPAAAPTDAPSAGHP